MTDRTRMSYWFPRIQQVLPLYPKTTLVEGSRELLHLLDGKKPDMYDDFLLRLEEAALQLGYPCFLRHDLSSGKHGWADTCFVQSQDQLPFRVANSIDHWYGMNLFANGGEELWAVREYVPVSPQVMTAFNEMPIGPERRYCVSEGKVVDHFPYWPVRAFSETPELLAKIGIISHEVPDEIRYLTEKAETAATALEGDWSIDFMHTERGWLLIDCAVLSQSVWPHMMNGNWRRLRSRCRERLHPDAARPRPGHRRRWA